MPNVRMPDGVVVTFPDDMPAEQIKGLIASKFPDAAVTPSAQQAQQAADYIKQNGVPGYNQAAFFGSAANAVPIIGPLLRGGLENLAAIPAMMKGTPYAQAKQDAQQGFDLAAKGEPMTAATGTVMGTMAPFGAAAATIPGAATGLGMEGGLLSQSLFGGGSGALISGADTLARGGSPSDAAVSGALGGAIGGLSPLAFAGLSKMFGKAASETLPTLDNLEAAKNNAYATVDQMGARYSPKAYDDMLSQIVQQAGADNINPELHKDAFIKLVQLEQRRGAPMSLTQLDQLRQEIWRDVASQVDSVGKPTGNAHFGGMMIDAIDNMIQNVAPTQGRAVSQDVANSAMLAARQSNATFRKSELLADILDRAYRQTAATGSGGNINNALKQAINRVLNSPALARRFNATELAQMRRIVMGGGKVQEFLRLVGKLSPSGNGLMAALSLGATVSNPAMAAAPAAGIVAKTISDNATKGGVDALTQLVRTGAVPPAFPKPVGALPPGYTLPLWLQRQPMPAGR